VDPLAFQQNALSRVAAIFLAGVLLLQLALACGVVASARSGVGATFGAICAAEKAPGSDGRPVAPEGGHPHGLCCILHCGALDAPPEKPQLSYILNFPAEALTLALGMSAPAQRVEPRRSPQSPRAPPFVG
jgi:hypothetical protein